MTTDTIAALATPAGKGGVGIVRTSGPNSRMIAQAVLGFDPIPRHVHYTAFLNENKQSIDQGVALYFAAPHSFTGEEVLELQGHGGPVVMDMLLKRVLTLGARLAQPGEFSQRAFLNDKIDLAQAEAIADLINSASEQAAKSAVRSLQGEFSSQIHALNEKIISLRLYVESAIDFASEEIDFLSEENVAQKVAVLLEMLTTIYQKTQQGVLLQEGMTVVIAGRPNAGKSSLLNCLSGKDSAIVTDIPGTTRDVLREAIHIDGLPLHIIDTAGLRESTDLIEQEGIRRAWQEIQRADRILLVVDATNTTETQPDIIWPEFVAQLPSSTHITVVRNKADLTGEQCGEKTNAITPTFSISAKNNDGIDILKEHLKKCVGFANMAEGGFIARRRHMEALHRAQQHIATGFEHLQARGAGELLAEELRLAHNALSEITGAFNADDLLGAIFSNFCIGK